MILNSYNDDATVTVTLDLDDLTLLSEVLDYAADGIDDDDLPLLDTIDQAQSDVDTAIRTIKFATDEDDEPEVDTDGQPSGAYTVTVTFEPSARLEAARFVANLMGDDESEWTV